MTLHLLTFFLFPLHSGFIIHPNVGAILVVDKGDEPVNNSHLKQFLEEHKATYPLAGVELHQFFTLRKSFEEDITDASGCVLSWLDRVNSLQRTPHPLSELKVKSFVIV